MTTQQTYNNQTPEAQIRQTQTGLKNSIYDGAFATIFGNLTGSMFLPAYALVLGAGSLHIGMLAAAPFFANLIQIAAAYFAERYDNRKTICIVFAILARATWLLIILASLTFAASAPSKLLVFVILLVIVQHLLSSVSAVNWFSWMSALVPEDIRGRYFGLRNFVVAACNLTFTLAAGWFLDLYTRQQPLAPAARKFEWLFAFAVLSGMVSIFFLTRKPYTAVQRNETKLDLRELYSKPLKQAAFRKLLVFAGSWSMMVKLASPYFIVYMFQKLNFDYSFVALLTVCSAFADMTGMWIWGHLSDRFGNKPVVAISGFFISLIPFFWLLTYPGLSGLRLLVIVLHLFSSFFWAGFNLCSVNLVYAMAPRERNTGYFAYWSAANGLASGVGAIIGGVLAYIGPLLQTTQAPIDYKTIFLLSGILRLSSLLLLRTVTDPKSAKTMHVIRILRNVKSWSGLMGFDPILHFFLPKKKKAVSESSPYWPLWQFRRSFENRRHQ